MMKNIFAIFFTADSGPSPISWHK